jgi:hypothetical protein
MSGQQSPNIMKPMSSGTYSVFGVHLLYALFSSDYYSPGNNSAPPIESVALKVTPNLILTKTHAGDRRLG